MVILWSLDQAQSQERRPAIRVVSVVPTEWNAVRTALRLWGQPCSTEFQDLSTGSRMRLWTRPGSSFDVLDVYLGSPTNAFAAAAMYDSQQYARRQGRWITRTVVYACAGGLFDGKYAAALGLPGFTKTEIQGSIAAWLDGDHVVYRVRTVVLGSWGSVSGSPGNLVGRQVVRVHDPIYPPSSAQSPQRPIGGQPETRRAFVPDISGDPWKGVLDKLTTLATSLAVDSVYKVHPLAWQRKHWIQRCEPAAERKCYPPWADRVDHYELAQLVQRLVAAAATCAKVGGVRPIRIRPLPQTLLNREKAPDTAVVVDMESMGLWAGSPPDSVVLRVVTDLGFNKNANPAVQHSSVPGSWAKAHWILDDVDPPVDPPDIAQTQRLIDRSDTLLRLLKEPHEAVTIESLASAVTGVPRAIESGVGVSARNYLVSMAIMAGKLRVMSATPEGAVVLHRYLLCQRVSGRRLAQRLAEFRSTLDHLELARPVQPWSQFVRFDREFLKLQEEEGFISPNAPWDLSSHQGSMGGGPRWMAVLLGDYREWQPTQAENLWTSLRYLLNVTLLGKHLEGRYDDGPQEHTRE